MELRHLRHFIAVAEELHFARAAVRVGIEQSPLSQSIRNLESSLGVRLLLRTTRRTQLTEAGNRFYHDAKRLMREIDNLVASVRELEVGYPKAVRLVLGEDLASEHFTQLLRWLERCRPDINLQIIELQCPEAIRLLLDGGADVAFTLYPEVGGHLTHQRAWGEPVVAAMPIGHRLSALKEVSLHDLVSDLIVLPSPVDRPSCFAQMERFLVRHDAWPAKHQTVRHWNTAISLAASGHSIALCPVSILGAAMSVIPVPIKEGDAEIITWISYSGSDRSPAVSLIVKAAAEISSLNSRLSLSGM